MSSNNVVVSFKHDFTFYSVTVDGFTNYTKDADEFIEKHCLIFSKIIPNISINSIAKLRSDGSNHTHPLSSDKKNLALKIVKELVKVQKGYNSADADRFIDNSGFVMYNFWQLSFATSNGIRLIGYFVDNNVFVVLFIDYHHLIEPDKNYNQKNYEKYDYCPYKGVNK